MLKSYVVLPYPYYNLIQIFTSAVLLFWFLWSLSRFLDMLKVRIAILSNRVIPIRGISNYLSTISEISTQSHIHAIIHTRQANPPKPIKSMYLPFSIDSITLHYDSSNNTSSYYPQQMQYLEKRIESTIWTTNRCMVIFLLELQVHRLKQLLKVRNNTNSQAVQFNLFLESLISKSGSSSILASNEVCINGISLLTMNTE